MVLFIHGCSQPKMDKNGAVSSTSRIASQVGIDILKKGGNAFDAIVATGFALAVTSPSNGNLGGGGFLVARTADGELVSLDFREKAPKLSFESMFLDEEGNYVRDLALFSHISSGVPGTVNGLIKIYNDYGSGKFTLTELLQPAINLADNGFAIEPTAAHGFDTNKSHFIKDEGSKKLFIKNNDNVITDLESKFSNGELSSEEYKKMLNEIDEWKPGDIFIQKDLANTLRRIAKSGNKGFYEGETAQYIIDEMKLMEKGFHKYGWKWEEGIVAPNFGFVYCRDKSLGKKLVDIAIKEDLTTVVDEFATLIYVDCTLEEYIEKYTPRVLKGRSDQNLIYDNRLHDISRKFTKWLDTKIEISEYFEHV